MLRERPKSLRVNTREQRESRPWVIIVQWALPQEIVKRIVMRIARFKKFLRACIWWGRAVRWEKHSSSKRKAEKDGGELIKFWKVEEGAREVERSWETPVRGGGREGGEEKAKEDELEIASVLRSRRRRRRSSPLRFTLVEGSVTWIVWLDERRTKGAAPLPPGYQKMGQNQRAHFVGKTTPKAWLIKFLIIPP